VPTVHVVVPAGIDDPARPSGGNRYDRRLCDGLAAAGWAVREHAVPGDWPRPDVADLGGLARTAAGVPDDAVVVVDGLIGSAAASVLVPEAARLRLVVLVHMPFLGPADDERAVLAHARAVVTTSAWTRDRLVAEHALPPARVHVAVPGTDPGDPAPGTDGGGRLLCVAAVVPHKGQDLLLRALEGVPEASWRCRVVGPLDRDPVFVERLRRRVSASGIGDRVAFAGPRHGDALRREFARADLLVAPSRSEAYGMAAAEALAVGLPVVATAVGGLPEAFGRTRVGVPGLLVPPEDPHALRAALSAWLRDPALRARLRAAALARRDTLDGWDGTTARVAAVLTAVGPREAVAR
jgi:glycosyltransferase involved in cell wall biosynthesis